MREKFLVPWRLLVGCLLLIGLLAPVYGASVADGETWVAAGSFQDEISGCGDWDNACPETTMEDLDGDGVHRLVVDGLAAGGYEYKIVESGNWDNAHPAGNVTLNAAGSQVRWYFQPGPNRVADNVNQCIATVAGSFQSELGGNDWSPDNLRTMLWQESPGSDWYALTVTVPAGNWEYKVARNEDWAESYPGGNVALNLDEETAVTFRYNCATNEVEHSTELPPADPEWVVAGNFQDDWPVSSGCGEWNNACLETGMEDDNGDGVYRLVADGIPAGGYEYKVVEFGNWDNAHPAGNVPIAADGSQVRWYFQPGPNRVADNVNQCIATVAGSFQDELGGPEWAPDNLRTMLWQESPGSDWYALTATIPAGDWAYKVARNEGWDESYPAGDVPLSLDEETAVTFRYNCATNEVQHDDGSSDDGAAHDNDIWWNDLGHNSRDPLYRTPTGPVTAGTEVTVRLRAASGDLTQARVRVWDDRINAQFLLDMSLAADDGVYEWWEATLPVSADPTLYWYRFIAIDGSATAYYEDDDTRDGGWGQTYGDSPDNSWQLTMYNPAFSTPDWVKNGVMYQIFPDRFRNGDPGNDPQPGRFFYGELDGTIYRSDPDGGVDNPWNTAVCDPRDANDCPGTYSLNFYGGDLQGVIDQLNYLDDLGVTILYFNPIFESPSNHKYDTTDYGVISRDFGDLATFQTLVTEANSRGMSIVLDGVFNHTSSDSIYFDRYSRFDAAGNETSPDPGVNDGSGACESETSPYRDWYYFTDVAAGTGPCVGSDGTPGGATYESWFGFDSLPKLNAANPEVRDLIFDGGPQSVALYWLAEGGDGWRFDVGGDVDPGLTNDPTNDYWEQFRSTTRALNPDAYMVLEEWGNASAWLLGDEMDATMNYQYSSAMLSFWRDTTFTDNDHNSGSSAGELVPLTPSQLDARLHNWIERYPAEAMYAMMNLLGSHDTNRALFMVDENAANGTSAAPLLDPNYDWSDALTRLKGVVLLQMTLPGAPTIYYGDEVGLVGPTYYHGGKWEDDPYNRQPFPWPDESGTPFYTHMQSGGAGWTDLLPYYQTLTAARNSHEALRTGSFDTLLVDDGANVYAYGRFLTNNADAAVILVNRAGAAQTITVNVSGKLPVGATFTDALNGGSYTVSASGEITVPNVPAMNGAVLVADGPMAQAPAAVNDLAATAVANDAIDLTWSAASGATSYDVYRSPVSGGGYAFVANVSGTSYSDSGLAVATRYYYVVVSRDDATLLASGNSNEAAATPAYNIGWANLQWPPSINHTISAVNRTADIYGQIWIDGVTSQPGATPGLLAQVGFGPSTTIDNSWTWEPMSFNGDVGNNDEYVGTLLPDELGVFCYTTRYSGDGGASWFYAVNGPDEGNATCPGPFGVLTVVAGADTTAPTAVTNLEVAGTTNSSITLNWDAHPNTDGDLYGFEVYRENAAAPGFERIATIANPAATAYTDDSVTTGATYTYYVVAFDDSYNRADASNTATGTAEPRLVSVTFRIGVPDYTPGTVYIVGDIPQFGPWNPGLVPMTQVDATTWEYTIDLMDGLTLQYKFTRGSWDTVESWGSIVNINNRSVQIDYGASGVQLVDMTATDWGNGPDSTKAVQFWRDPLVVSTSPADGATDAAVDTAVSVVWSVPMEPNTQFVVEGPGGVIAGAFAYDAGTQTVTFTPDAALDKGATVTVTVAGAVSVGVPGGDSGVQQSPFVFSFSTEQASPAEMFAALRTNIQTLVADGEMFAFDGNRLLLRLDRAERLWEIGRADFATRHLNGFIADVQKLVRIGRLDAAIGDDLVAQAQAIIDLLNP